MHSSGQDGSAAQRSVWVKVMFSGAASSSAERKNLDGDKKKIKRKKNIRWTQRHPRTFLARAVGYRLCVCVRDMIMCTQDEVVLVSHIWGARCEDRQVQLAEGE